MITNAGGTLAISNLRWVDGGNIWSYSIGEAEPQLIPLPGTKSVSLADGTGDYFAVLYHSESESSRLTAHSFQNIPNVLSSIDLPTRAIGSSEFMTTVTARFAGDVSVWSFLPKAYMVHDTKRPLLLMIDVQERAVEVHHLPWYSSSYDTMYQGIVGVTKVPSSSLFIISLQRDSEPVLYDPSTGKVVSKLKLAGRSGNPELFFRRKAPELWASDYDTLVKLDSRTWETLGTLRLQGGRNGMERLFIGQYCFSNDESLCIAARPYSGDVVGIDPRDFRVVARADMEGQPLEIGVLSQDQVIARDWKTGNLLRGILKRV